MSSTDPSILNQVAEVLADADHVVVLTGAGVSAESGVPTFREAQTGLWSKFKPEQLATPEAFRTNPKRVWEWYAWRRKQLRGIRPNPAHVALAQLELLVPRFTLITQNVDGLHQQAGNSDVVELHGNIQRTKCFEEDLVISDWLDSGEVPPRCPQCNGFLRPDVVWFGEMLPQQALSRAFSECGSCDVLLSVGTSGLVYPAAALPYAALDHGASVIEVNPTPSPLAEQAAHSLRGPAGTILPALVGALKKTLGNREA